ncbi:AAA family ATPase [Chloroflexota bacterium]
MSSVIAEIKQWASSLPYWEQAALDKIMSGTSLTNDEYGELVDYLLDDAGLTTIPKQHPKLIHLIAAESTTEPKSGPFVLNKIFNLQNINALPSSEKLTFCPKLTAIFGETGSGKSGYARILGCAGFTRGDKDVLPNITKPWDNEIIRSADIEVSIDNSTKVINYQVGNRCDELSQCYIFDSTSVHVHLAGSNTFSFSPAGLIILTILAYATDKVRQLLQDKIEEYRKPHDFGDLFQGVTEVTDFIQTLGPNTKLEELMNLANLSLEGNKRISQLDFDIATLKTRDVPKQVNRLNQTVTDLEKLVKQLGEIEAYLNSKGISDLNNAIQQYLKRESLSQNMGTDQFKSEYFSQIGSESWHSFIVSAKALADLESPIDSQYPQVNDRCLLCRQPLDTDSQNLLLNIWKYLEGDAQLQLDQSHNNLGEKRNALASINLGFFNEQSVSYRHLKEHDVELLGIVIKYIEECRERRDLALKMIDAHKEISISPLPIIETVRINKIIAKLSLESSQLEQQNTANRIIELGQELLTLQHRQILSKNISKIRSYIDNLKWAERASRVGGNTRHITKKYGELFESLVTDQYLKLFESFLQNLRRYIKVKVKTRGQKGKTIKQIVLEMDPTIDAELVTPDKVLSEGEKRAVALADFLTEVALDTTSSTIILDDPVTSLDLEWKETISSILVDEASRRQVIVFTHDLPFLYLIKKYSGESNIDIATHWIQRREDKPGFVFLDNSPALEKEYCKTTRAHDLYQKANNSSAEEQENYLRLGFGALRTCYEAFIIYELFQGVVLRFDVRVSPGRLKNIRWDESIASEVNKKYEYLSRYFEGHLQSDGYVAKADPALLLKEIESFEALRNKHKSLKSVKN